MSNDPQSRPPQAPPAYLKLTLQGNILLAMVTPSAYLDGQPLPVKYGENVFAIHPGDHLVAAHAQSFFAYGRAEQQISAEPGQVVELWYAPPAVTFLKGRMGATRQKIAGMTGFLVGIAAIVALTLVIVALAATG